MSPGSHCQALRLPRRPGIDACAKWAPRAIGIRNPALDASIIDSPKSRTTRGRSAEFDTSRFGSTKEGLQIGFKVDSAPARR